MRSVNRTINQEILDLGRAKFDEISGFADMDRDKNGFIILKPSAANVDRQKAELTTNISSLEMKLKEYREKQEKIKKIQKSDDYKESKKAMSKKKIKKKKASLLEMVFNDADADAESEDEDDEIDEDADGTYIDKKKKPEKKKASNTLETTYGKRFSPVVSMLYDTITEFDQIASDIDQDLKNSKNSSRTMYRSSQIGNLISAKNSKLSAVKELASVAKTLFDLEYKKEHEKKMMEGSNSNKAVASIAAKYLSGSLDELESSGGKKKKKDKKGKKSPLGINRVVDDDDDEEYGSISKNGKDHDEGPLDDAGKRALSKEFAASLVKHKNDIKFTPWEKNIGIEGTYNVIVVADPTDLNSWRFAAIDAKSGKEITDFKDKYKDLLPKKKKCRLQIDLGKMRAFDRNSAKTYKLVCSK